MDKKFQIYYYENDECVDVSDDYANMRGAIDDAEQAVADADAGKDFRAEVVEITTVAEVDRHYKITVNKLK